MTDYWAGALFGFCVGMLVCATMRLLAEGYGWTEEAR